MDGEVNQPMRRLRQLSVSLFLLTAFPWAIASSAQASTPLPFTSTYTKSWCGNAAAAADSDHCKVTPTVSTSTGAVGATTRLMSPQGGLAAWAAVGQGDTEVIATHHLASPVPKLNFTVNIHVNQASITLKDLPNLGGLAGSYESNLVHPWLNHFAGVDVIAGAVERNCSSAYCSSGGGERVVWAAEPGTVTASGKDYTLHVALANPSGGNLPVGDVTVLAGVDASSVQGNSAGNDLVSVDAVVTGISVD
jgi:hypothetical protein